MLKVDPPLPVAPLQPHQPLSVPLSVDVPLICDKQTETNWCWAALTISIERFYHPNRINTQCRLANAVLARNDCCHDDHRCNNEEFLNRSLGHVECLEQADNVKAEDVDVEASLAKQRPVCIRVQHQDGAHCLGIVGASLNYWKITDPGQDRPAIQFFRKDMFPDLYLVNGIWTHTYWTTS